MSRSKAAQTSRDRLVANMIVTLLASPIFVFIWLAQRPKPAPAQAVDGWGPPELPL